MKREAFVCPYCGAPQPDRSEFEGIGSPCHFCGKPLSIFREVENTTGWCQNHPDVSSIGTCDKCGQEFCGDCLHVYRYLEHVCEKCLEEMGAYGRMKKAIEGLILVAAGMYLVPSPLGPHFLGFNAFAFLLLIVGLWLILWPTSYPLLADEINIADMCGNQFEICTGSIYVECLNCGAGYYYGPEKLGPDRMVVCQNCNRRINLQGEIDQSWS